MPSTPKLLQPTFEADHVYLVQLPRAGVIPTPSAYALKLETWLRMNNVPYTNVDNEFTKMSERGQIPFIELNGKQYADSTQIIEHLTKHFNKSIELTPTDKALSQAFYTLIEHHFCWLISYSRGQDLSWFATDAGYGRNLTGVKGFLFKNVMLGSIQKKYKNKVAGQGIGTLTQAEIIDQAKKDIDALSIQLADKPYLFGSAPTWVDATLFGHMCQMLYTPQFTPEYKNYIESNAKNLIEYINRIKSTYWSDWEDTCASQNLHTKWQKE